MASYQNDRRFSSNVERLQGWEELATGVVNVVGGIVGGVLGKQTTKIQSDTAITLAEIEANKKAQAKADFEQYLPYAIGAAGVITLVLLYRKKK